MSVAKPSSHCPNCKSEIKWYDNIPVLSYCLLGAKCRNCKTHIPFRYTAVELANMVLWLICVKCFWHISIVYAIICALVLSTLLCVFFIDLENLIIPDRFQIILAVAGIVSIFFDKTSLSGNFNWLTHIIGAVAGFAVFWLFAIVGEKIAGREALGGGDIKLSAVMGLFLGWQKLLLAVIIASFSACIIIFCLKIFKKEKSREYPFGPFLSVGFAVAMLFGDSIINGYMSLFI